MNKPEKDRVFYITHSLELLVWLVIILFVTAGLTITHIKREKTNNDYTIFLPDVDGLIVGSPVRMMGVEVGHVIKIKPAGDEVYVKFLIKDNSIKIPQGTQATVEFSGMAGSKSLELYPPDENTYIDSTVPILTINPPKRLHDVFGLLNDMFNRLGNIITTTSIFSRHIQAIDMPKGGEKQDFGRFLQYSDKVLDDSIKRAEDFEVRFLNNGK